MNNETRKKLSYAAVAGFVAGAGAIGLSTKAGLAPWAEPEAVETAGIGGAGQIDETIQGQETEIESLQAEISGLNDRIAELTESLAAREEEIARLTGSSADGDPAAADPEMVSEFSNEIESLRAVVAERDKTIEELNLALGEAETPDGETVDLEATLAERDQEISELRTAMTDLEREIETLKDASTDFQDVAIMERDAKIEELTLELTGMQTELDDLKSGAVQMNIAAIDATGEKLNGDMPASASIVNFSSAAPEKTVEALQSQISRFENALAAIKATTAPDEGAPTPPISEIHFETNSSKLTTGGQARTMAAAQAILDMDLEKVKVFGHTDTTGSAEYNARLSKARAESVRDALIEAGVAPETIEVAGLGETPDVLPISTSDGVSEPLNRCVGIYPASAG